MNALPVAPTLIEVLDVLGPESDSLRVTLPALTAAGEIVEHPPHGRRLRAWLGYANAELYNMGEYIVSGVDFQRSAAGYILTVSADTVAALEAIKAPVDRSRNNIAIEDVFAAGAGEPVYRMRHPFAGEGEARLAAEAMLGEFERAVADFTVAMPGRPEIRTGHLVDCATRFPVAGVWYVAEAQHVYDGGGLTTRLRLTAANGRG